MPKNTEKPFTWKDLKKAINRMPDKQLTKEIVLWTDDERAYKITCIEVLEEDYVHDGDQGCAPKSDMKEAIEEEKRDHPGEETEHYVVHEKGTRILYGE